MLDAFSIMKWPLVACLVLPVILVYYGLHIVRREIIFVDLALAQVAALGSTVAIFIGYGAHDWENYVCSLGFTLVGAAIFTLTRTKDHRVPQEALIGIVFVIAAAAGMLILSRTVEGDEELRRTLVGELLLVRPGELAKTAVLYLVIGGVHYLFRKQFLLLSFDPQRAVAEGLSVRSWDFLFYALFGLVVTSFVHIGGVLLIFSYLIVPAVCANLMADSLQTRVAVGCAISTLASLAGLYSSYRWDLPTGESIVCALGAALLITGLAVAFRPKATRP